MKNRKTIIVGFILVACMLVGVGYAAVSNNFLIKGAALITEDNAEVQFNENIRFEGVVVPKAGGGTEVKSDVLLSDGFGYSASCNIALDEASFHITDFEGKDDTKTITFQIKNYGEVPAKLYFTSIDDNPLPLVFEVTTNLQSGELDLDAGATAEVTVTVTVLTDVAEQTSAEFNIKFYAEDELT